VQVWVVDAQDAFALAFTRGYGVDSIADKLHSFITVKSVILDAHR